MSSLSFVVSIVQGLHGHQVKTLAAIVDAMLQRPSGILADLARYMSQETGVKLNHTCKRIQGFLGNNKLKDVYINKAIIDFLFSRLKCKRWIAISIDWTHNETRERWCTLQASVVLRGRGVPILAHCYHKNDYDPELSRNKAEERFIKELISLLPSSDNVVIVADRGFGRSSFIRFLQNMNLNFVLRVACSASIVSEEYTGSLKDLSVSRGKVSRLRKVVYSLSDPVHIRQVVFTCSAKPDQHDPWFLVTDLPVHGNAVAELYALRMIIEEDFRESKSRFGWSDCRIKKLSHYRRFVTVVNLAIAFSVLVGTVIKRRPTLAALVSRKRKGSWDLGYTMMGLRLLQSSLDNLKYIWVSRFQCPL